MCETTKVHNTPVLIRLAAENDIPVLHTVATALRAQHEKNYFERCLTERRVFIALHAGEPVGYAQFNAHPAYRSFHMQGIPEIQDLGVVPNMRGQGIGHALIKYIEEYARQKGDTQIGISVGLHRDFGPAQRLYIACGYVADGAGVTYDDVPVSIGDIRPIDDLLTLKLIKNL